MTREKFEAVAQEVFDGLPPVFGERVDNVAIVVEEYPPDDVLRSVRATRTTLLGLYQGIPLTQRGQWYGMVPTAPDRISLYQRNIEADSSSEEELREKIREVLLHELGHYFGMSEAQIRRAMRNA